jgi:hypothetical protein
VGRLSCSAASCPSGSVSSRRLSVWSATRNEATRRSALCAGTSCCSMAASRSFCSLGANATSAVASEGPMAPWASWSAASGPSPVASARRRSTQSRLRPNRWATVRGERSSSCTSEQTTRASSIAVNVRGGALAQRSRRLCSVAAPAGSITTGTSACPCSRQRLRRLNPSKTS